MIENTYSYTINCTTTPCQDTIINCLPNEDCLISCEETQSCYGTQINCPIESGDCNIICKGGESCRESIINATLSIGNFNLLCEEGTDNCRDITVYGSILEDMNIGNYSIICDGNTRSCADANIKCPINSNCDISCLSDTSCRYSQIIGPINGNLNIECEGIKSCFDATFNGSKSEILNINGCTNDESCFDLSIYCPPNRNGIPNCFIEGNNNIGRDNAKGTKIYAINGWNDILINYNGTFGAFHDGMMFCGENYGIKCTIASDDWQCVNYNDYCNFNPTISPSLSPTISPSLSPTTYDMNSIYMNTTNNFTYFNNNITNNKSSLILKIVSSISAVSIICACIICIKYFQKWFVKRNLSKNNRNEGEEDSDLFGFVLKVTGSDQRDFMDDTEMSEPGRTDYINKTKKLTLDPLDISYNCTQPLQPQRSLTDNTYLSAPISELDSPNCIPHANRFSTDLSKYNNYNPRKISDISLNGNNNHINMNMNMNNSINYNHNAPIKEYITPRPPPRNKKLSNDLSSVSSEAVSSIHTSQTTQESDHHKEDRKRDSFSDIYKVISRKPTTEL